MQIEIDGNKLDLLRRLDRKKCKISQLYLSWQPYWKVMRYWEWKSNFFCDRRFPAWCKSQLPESLKVRKSAREIRNYKIWLTNRNGVL